MQIIFEDAQRGHVMKEGKLPEDLLDDIAKVTCTTARGASGQKYGILWWDCDIVDTIVEGSACNAWILSNISILFTT
jgi:hypothetical protein